MELNVTQDQVNKLSEEAGRKLLYGKQEFTYDKEISVTEVNSNQIKFSLQRLGVSFQPTEFQVFEYLAMLISLSESLCHS